MGQEIEIKLAAPEAATLEKVRADAHGCAALCTPWREVRMETEYLDTPERAIAAHKWMLRRRSENGTTVFTMKTPGDGYVRGEWESRKESLHEAVRELVRLGAPGELAELAARGVSRTCGVEFLRRTAELTLDGARCAQVMLVVGTDQGGLEHPDWQENLANALKMQALLNRMAPGLCRDIDLRTERFNQHETPGSLLVEFGCTGNTLAEALRSAEYFGRAVCQLWGVGTA